MCGIVGFYFSDQLSPIQPQLVAGMVETLAHRGPDDRGQFVGPGIALGVTRLSVIDVDGGHQPIVNEDGSKVIVFNGEIYNFQELRRELEQRGHVFCTQSDTEVILHGFEEWGADCVGKLNGIFAFAIWDQGARTLFLARDHLGVKPLYYWTDEECLIFASEIKAILAHPRVTRRLNLSGLRTYLTFGHSIAPDTIFQGIAKLLPGHWLQCQSGLKVRLAQYWDISGSEPMAEVDGLWPEKIRSLLDEVVGMQLMADVPLGAFLSGGLDSSAIVALMAQRLTEPVQTFSLGFRGADSFYNELPDAGNVAGFLKTEHQVMEAGPEDLVRVLPLLVYHYDEPFADAAAFPTYLVAHLARQKVKVVLTGDGGDEIFGGYLRYSMDTKVAWTLNLPSFFLRGLGRLAQPFLGPRLRFQRGLIALSQTDPARRAASWYMWFTPELCQEMLQPQLWREVKDFDPLDRYARYYRDYPFAADRANRMMYADLKTQLVDSYLEKVDKATMAVGLEARVPFLDYRLVEMSLRIPSSEKFNFFQSKLLLRKAMADLLPPATLNKPKHGFAVPLDPWMRGPLKDYVAAILFDERTRTRGFFNQKRVEQLFEDHQAQRASFSTHLWFLLVFELWCRTFLDGDGKP